MSNNRNPHVAYPFPRPGTPRPELEGTPSLLDPSEVAGPTGNLPAVTLLGAPGSEMSRAAAEHILSVPGDTPLVRALGQAIIDAMSTRVDQTRPELLFAMEFSQRILENL